MAFYNSFYTCRYLDTLIYIPLQISRIFWPRMFYRSGWLRCDLGNGIWFWFGGFVLVWCLGVYVIILYIYYYYILYYTLLSSDLSSSSLPNLSPPLPILNHSNHLIYIPIIWSSSTILIYLQFCSSLPLFFILSFIPSSSHLISFYTCRHLDILIYIQILILKA